MAEERKPMTTTDVAGTIRAMASFLWNEMLDVRRAILEELRDSGEERAKIVDAIWESGSVTEIDAGSAAVGSAAKPGEAREAVTELQDRTAKSVAEFAACLSQCEWILVSIQLASRGPSAGPQPGACL